MKRNLVRVGIVVVAILFICTNYCFATGLESTKLVTGTKNLITDLTNWLLILAPTVTVVLIGYYLIRRAGSDEGDGRRWADKKYSYYHACSTYPLSDCKIKIIIKWS